MGTFTSLVIGATAKKNLGREVAVSGVSDCYYRDYAKW
jgi:hypothetical protein